MMDTIPIIYVTSDEIIDSPPVPAAVVLLMSFTLLSLAIGLVTV